MSTVRILPEAVRTRMTAGFIIALAIAWSCLLLVACNEQKTSPPSAAPVQDSQSMRGQEVYLQACAACHGTGLAGAPKFGDRAAWAPRIAHGIDHLTASVVQGKGNMPARGGQAGLNDKDIRAAVGYMMEKSK